MNSETLKTDFLIIGSGAAGLSAALHASQYGRVILLTKSGWKDSSSYHAQGGIAAALQNYDSFQSHKQDTLDAGRDFCNVAAVDVLVKEGAREIQRYIDLGMEFDRKNGSWDLGLEGGHSNRRVLHANGAATGKALVNFLSHLVKTNSNITIIEHAFVFKLFHNDNKKSEGAAAFLYDEKKILSVFSPVTVLATGGYAGLFERTTNPHTSTGDGLWLGHRAGATLRDLEFVQFHPTAFYDGGDTCFLISEAVRGEGAYLYNQRGERFMANFKQQELAPRDVVAREIFHQIQNQDLGYVYLDISHLNTDKIRLHFPNLCEKIEKQGVDIDNEGIPVAPAAHYCIGGIATDLHAQTSVEGLYACGEIAATGAHGANRLASNSLLECLVFSKRAINHSANVQKSLSDKSFESDFSINDKAVNDFKDLKQRISLLLNQYVGIYRNKSGLEYALDQIDEFAQKVSVSDSEYYSLRSNGLLRVAKMITKAALKREESRGVHMRSDFPGTRGFSDHIFFQN
ncbi:MAG TPA: L-aspartate oxidase [Balneolaceae bacterium]|nr:L-aspartate oxidase [Balneolaceae bacterium]